MSRGKWFLLFLIFTTSLLYFLLLTEVDFTLYNSDPEVFWLRFSATLGSIIGFVAINLMLWQVTLGNRHIVRLFTPDLIWATKVHTFIGKYALLIVILHPLLIMYSYLEDLLWLITPNFETTLGKHIALGRMALITFFLIWVSSALLRSKIKYRPWLYIHYLTYLIIFFVFLHAREIGTYLTQIALLEAFWYTLFAGFIIVLIWRVLLYTGFFKKQFEVVKVEEQSGDQVVIDLKPLGDRITQIVGQFNYLQINNFGESHPFTTYKFNKDGDLHIAFEKVGRFTDKLALLNKGDVVKLDGPFGVFTKEGQNSVPKVILAGGIGVTPFIELVNRFSNDDTYMFYSVRKREDVLDRELLLQRLGENLKICVSREEISAVEEYRGRMDKTILLENISEEQLEKYNFFICGSSRYIKGMKEMLFELGIPKDQVFQEEFSI